MKMEEYARDESPTPARFEVAGCRFAPNDGRGDCFSPTGKVAGNSAYAQRVLLSDRLGAEDLNRYRELLRACELELQESSKWR